jgi:hypothetical protein
VSGTDYINGITDLIFEVVYGAAEGLHSKASEVLITILQSNDYSPPMIMLIRFLFLKLFNEVDTEK